MNLRKTFKNITLSSVSIFLAASATAQLQIIDRIAAIVDEDVVMQSELDTRMIAVYQQLEQAGTQPPPDAILKEQVLERLISERLQLGLGYRAGVRITDAELNQAIGRVAAANKLSVEQYLQNIQAQGTTVADLRADIRKEMIIQRVQQGHVLRRIHISDQELDNFLNSEEGKQMTSPDVNLGHILLPVPSGSSAEEVEAVAQRAQQLLDQARDGADFKQLAIAHSSDQSALQGGDLGWRKLSQLPSLFIAAVESLEQGKIASPVRSGAGFHLLKLYQRRGGEEQLVEQHFARHILIKPNQIRDEQTSVKLLEELRQQATEEDNFSALAREYSEDSGSALKGGELGWSTPGMFVPEFEQTMNTIAINEISAPFQSQFGWHILQVTERRQQDFSQDIMRNRAKQLLSQRKFEEELQVWLQEIRDEAFVEIKGAEDDESGTL